jgi:hypothetical protein
MLYGDFAEESEFLRSGKSIYLELKSDDVEEMRQKIIDFGVRVVDVPDPHLYFQAPGGQVFRLVGINEDLSTYERDLSEEDALRKRRTCCRGARASRTIELIDDRGPRVTRWVHQRKVDDAGPGRLHGHKLSLSQRVRCSRRLIRSSALAGLAAGRSFRPASPTANGSSQTARTGDRA